MIGDVLIVLIYRITEFYSHGQNVSFLEYFHQHFLGDKWDESLKLLETQETRNLIRWKKPYFVSQNLDCDRNFNKIHL